jgi:hypothetical protein
MFDFAQYLGYIAFNIISKFIAIILFKVLEIVVFFYLIEIFLR